MSHTRRIRELAPAALAALAFLGACATPNELAHDADRAVDGIIGGSSERLNDERRATIEQPAKKSEQPPASEPEPTTMAPSDPAAAQLPEHRIVSLEEALVLAIGGNRDYMTQRESLYQTALSLTGTRHSYSPLITATLQYLFAGGDHIKESQAASASAGVSQILPTGGRLSLEGNAALSAIDDPNNPDPNNFSSGAAIHLTQPLLRGAGYEVAYEALTQAERSLMYEIRSFELYRENFSIEVATKYYSLVRQKQELENQQHNIDGLVFARRQAEALNKVGRLNELEVLRARRGELTSKNSLIEAQESYRLELDRFRIYLGLPETVHIDVRESGPAYIEVDYDVDSAVKVALVNRLDVKNRTEQLEDVERSVRISKNGLLPDVNLDLSYGLSGVADPAFVHQHIDNDVWSLGVNVDLPVDRLNERNSYRTALLHFGRAKRDYELFLQGLVVEVRSTFRGLVRRTQSLEIQRQLIEDQERNVKIARIRLEQGEVSNREVIEAQESLLDARNALIQEQVDYEIARLGLLRDLGILFIDEHGMWNP